MKKRILALSLCSAMLLSACGNVQTRDSVQPTTAAPAQGQESQAATGGAATAQPEDLRLLFYSDNEDLGNIVRDQFTKAGFNVILNMQPDYSSYKAQVDGGNYDVDITGWTTVTGNPDYAVRSLFKTGGDYNAAPYTDPKLDEFIEKAGTETPEEYIKTYTEFEKYLVEEMAYIIPLCQSMKTQAISNKRLDVESVRLSKSRSLPWEDLRFVDGIDPATTPFITSQTMPNLTSLDPIKGNDGSINIINTNQYIRLVNLTDDDQVTAVGSLSYNYGIAEGNSDYYFLLRDDVNFARVADGNAVDSGIKVAGEDVVFTLERAKDPKSVPNHKTYTLHESINTVEVLTDLSEIETAKASGSDKTIKEVLEAGIATPIATLVATKDSVDNSAGNYQVVKLTTAEPFPQVLNYLAHQSAGIVDSALIPTINTYEVESFDINKDICYGDQATITDGSTYNNTLSCSGPYIAIRKNDYEVTFKKNPAYMPGSEFEPVIENVTVKFYADSDSSLSAFRSGETDLLYSIPDQSWDVVESAPELTLQKIPSNATSFMSFNLKEGSKYQDVLLRKAAVAAINQEDLLAVFNGTRLPLYSTVSPIVNTGNALVFEPGKTQGYLAEYQNQ